MSAVQESLLGYLFVCFAVGAACLGVAVYLAVQRRSAVSRPFLAFYVAFSILVTASLLLAFADAAPGKVSESVRWIFQYLESIVGQYGLMLTLPILVHRVFGVVVRRREKVLVLAVLVTFALQHVTEFALGSTVWDQRGDWFEDGVLIALTAYVVWIAYSRRRSAEAQQPLAFRVFLLMLIGVPGVVWDLFYGEASGVRLYPIWYCLTSVVVTGTLVQGEAAPRQALKEVSPKDTGPKEVAREGGPTALDGWGLSERELEVANGVGRGLSNKEIAASLHISPNTVKTHMRAIFEKAGVRSRFELISRMSGFVSDNHPKG